MGWLRLPMFYPTRASILAGVCAQEACDISRYEIATKQFLCPCHAAYFNIEGTPVWGRVRRPLTKYETQLENNLLKIKL